MKKKLGIILLSSFCVLTACAPGQTADAATINTEASTMAETETSAEEKTETTAEVSEEKEQINPETFKDFADILGKSDDSVKDAMGGGKENISADGTILIGREYQTTFKDESVTVNTLYDDAENVNMVQVMLPGKDGNAYVSAITKELGAEPENTAAGEGGSPSTIWNSDGNMYTLFASYGENILEIIVPEN